VTAGSSCIELTLHTISAAGCRVVGRIILICGESTPICQSVIGLYTTWPVCENRSIRRIIREV
jgi:hypothetical protein